MISEPALYTGTLRHRRFRPREHRFSYKLFMAWLDIDLIPETMAQLAWTGYNRFNWASFHERDHFGDSALTLRERVARDAGAQGVTLSDGPIFLLTHLRYLGYCFNPISFFYCYDREGALQAVLAEVNSTFGEHRNYWLDAQDLQSGKTALHHQCAKTMHVSPFMNMDLDYEFVLTQPGANLIAHMNTVEQRAASLPLFDATLTLERQPWTAANVGRALLRHPWMTAKVIVGIHWEALLLFLKKVPVYTHPDRIKTPIEEAHKHS